MKNSGIYLIGLVALGVIIYLILTKDKKSTSSGTKNTSTGGSTQRQSSTDTSTSTDDGEVTCTIVNALGQNVTISSKDHTALFDQICSQNQQTTYYIPGWSTSPFWWFGGWGRGGHHGGHHGGHGGHH